MPATLTRTYQGTTQKVFNSNGGEWYYAFPSLILCADGRLRIVAYRSPQTSDPHFPTGNIEDGLLVTRRTTGVYVPGVAPTLETSDTLMPCNVVASPVVDNRTGQLIRLANGDECYVWFTHDWATGSGGETGTGSITVGYFSRSSDGWVTCTDPVVVSTKWRNGTSGCNQFVASSICELPNGHLLAATFSRQVFNQDKWDGRLARSTDGGPTWVDEGLVVGWEEAGYNIAEQQIIVRPDGKVVYYWHTEDNQFGGPGPQRGWAKVGTFASGYGGAITWGATTLVSSNSWNKQGACVTDDGDVILAFAPNNQYQVYKQSNSGDGITFDSQRNVFADLSAFTTGESKSQWVSPAAIGPAGVNGNMGITFGLGTGDLTQNCSVFFQAFTAASEAAAAGYGNTTSSGYDDGAVTVYTPPPASILVDPASTAWNQIDTQIVVRVTADAPSSVPVTFTSAGGSLVWFRGADADLFEVSLDGITWSPRLDVPAGETDGFLPVTPEAPGTTLTAEIGISV